MEAGNRCFDQRVPEEINRRVVDHISDINLPYSEIVKHAFLPAILCYVSLFYIVHLEALKMGMQPIIRREPKPLRDRVLRNAFGISGSIIVIGLSLKAKYIFSSADPCDR